LHYILIPAVTAFLAALLAIFLAPRFQHYFWKRQKREEIRLGIATEVNRPAAEFKTSYLFKDEVENITDRARSFFQAWISISGQIKDLFSPSTYHAFSRTQDHVITAPLFSTQKMEDRVPRITLNERHHIVSKPASEPVSPGGFVCK
jgi:hypothetical protein